MRKRRHPFRGLFFGLLLGLGLGLMSIVYGINTVGVITPWVAILVGILIGLLVAFLPSRKARRVPAR
jgi:ABC-type antimicrobial peptide transport system permease subunit